MALEKYILPKSFPHSAPCRISILVLLFFVSATSIYGQREKLVTVKRVLPLMRCDFEITVVARSEEIGYINIEEAIAEIRRIENMMSSWVEDSETSKVNRNAGQQPVKVSAEFFQIIMRAKQISEITEGAFDISFAALNRVWRYDGSMEYFPTPEEVYHAQQKVDYRNIILDENNRTVYLKEKGMRISFAGISKGYAAEKARDLLQARLVIGGIINAAGDITAWGTKVSGEQWIIGIDNPRGNENLFTWVPLYDGSVATSNSFSNYIEFRGKRYSHILDPRSGYPVSGIIKVAVFGRSAELCDALSTAVMVLGREKGMELIDQLTGVEAIILDNTHQQYRSSGFHEIVQRR